MQSGARLRHVIPCVCLMGALVVFTVLGGAGSPSVKTAQTASGDASARLRELVETHFEESLRLNSILASFIGDHRFDDRLPNDIGPRHRAATLALERRSLAALREIPRDSLGRQDRLTWDIFRGERELTIEGFRHPSHLLPVSQFFSTPNLFAMLGSGTSVHPFRNEKDYRNFLHRADDFVVWMDRAIVNMREGVKRGIVQPRVLMQKTLPQLDAMLVTKPEKSIFYRPLGGMPETIDAAPAANHRNA